MDLSNPSAAAFTFRQSPGGDRYVIQVADNGESMIHCGPLSGPGAGTARQTESGHPEPGTGFRGQPSGQRDRTVGPADHQHCEVAWIGPRPFYEKVAGIAAERRFVVMTRSL